MTLERIASCNDQSCSQAVSAIVAHIVGADDVNIEASFAEARTLYYVFYIVYFIYVCFLLLMFKLWIFFIFYKHKYLYV